MFFFLPASADIRIYVFLGNICSVTTVTFTDLPLSEYILGTR